MMRRKLWRDTAAKLGFAERRVELMAETIDPVAVHTAIREFVSRKKLLEGKGANFAHLKQLRAYPEFNKWYEQLATFERMEPSAARGALAGYLEAEIRQWLATRARDLFDNDGQIDAGEWALLVRDAELFWLVEGVAAKEALAACRVAAGDPLWAPPPPDESAELRARELRQELEGQKSVLREEAQRNAQTSAALEGQTLALQSMERQAMAQQDQLAQLQQQAAQMMAQAASATEAAHKAQSPEQSSSPLPKTNDDLVGQLASMIGELEQFKLSKPSAEQEINKKVYAALVSKFKQISAEAAYYSKDNPDIQKLITQGTFTIKEIDKKNNITQALAMILLVFLCFWWWKSCH